MIQRKQLGCLLISRQWSSTTSAQVERLAVTRFNTELINLTEVNKRNLKKLFRAID